MDFELLHLPDRPAGPIEALRRWIVNPRRQMQAWGEKVPGLLGWMVFLTVVVELVVAHRYSSGLGSGPSAYAQAGIFGGLILFAELFLMAAASSVANVMEKEGRPTAALTYLNLGLTPLLLWLPVAVLARSLDWPDGIRMLALLLLVLRVGAHWREALQFSFRLTRLQTVIAFYGAGSAAVAIALAFLYVSVVARVLTIFSA